ncbi:hypothetical protein N9934_04060, partial [Desulfosarcina sp.]|nr:hypothetical protein [Desulfosarcina sp.]
NDSRDWVYVDIEKKFIGENAHEEMMYLLLGMQHLLMYADHPVLRQYKAYLIDLVKHYIKPPDGEMTYDQISKDLYAVTEYFHSVRMVIQELHRADEISRSFIKSA